LAIRWADADLVVAHAAADHEHVLGGGKRVGLDGDVGDRDLLRRFAAGATVLVGRSHLNGEGARLGVDVIDWSAGAVVGGWPNGLDRGAVAPVDGVGET